MLLDCSLLLYLCLITKVTNQTSALIPNCIVSIFEELIRIWIVEVVRRLVALLVERGENVHAFIQSFESTRSDGKRSGSGCLFNIAINGRSTEERICWSKGFSLFNEPASVKSFEFGNQATPSRGRL